MNFIIDEDKYILVYLVYFTMYRGKQNSLLDKHCINELSFAKQANDYAN